MKRLLVSMVALLAFSMLSTSVLAIKPDYYMASFYCEAGGKCWIQDFMAHEAYIGKGSAHVRGSAIVREDTLTYWANRSMDPNTRLWTRRTYITASWNNSKLTVWMWPSYTAFADIYVGEVRWALLGNLTYFGYYKGEGGLQFVSGTARIYHGPTSPILALDVYLYVGTELWLAFYWMEDSIYPKAQYFTHRVTVWGPIPWHPSGP